jgi:hypothetical protein
MNGGDANPITTNLKEGIIGNFPMFNYNHDNIPMPIEENKKNGESLQIDPKAVKEAKEKRETEEKAEISAERLKDSKQPVIEGIEANKLAFTKKMEANAKKDKIEPPITAPPAPSETEAKAAAAAAPVDTLAQVRRR